MAAGIASGFVRKLYRILDHESEAIIGWDAGGQSFSIHDASKLNDAILPRYFRGRLCAFRQQLIDHGFEQLECEDNETRECYRHAHFVRGRPDQLGLIFRNPKPKRKGKGQSLSSAAATATATAAAMVMMQQQQQQPPPQGPTNGRSPSARSPKLGVHVGPTAPLTVTLTTAKRSSPSHAVQDPQKRQRTTTPTVTATTIPTPVNVSRNPLFSNDPDPGLDVARVFSLGRISDSGILPASTDLPEPISYLSKIMNSTASASSAQSSSSAQSMTTPAIDTPVFSEDMIKSALFFLVSTSTTGTNPRPDAPATVTTTGSDASKPAVDPNSWEAKLERLSTSGFLSSLLVSSATGGANVNGANATNAPSATAANPLFSNTSSVDDEEEDSIWNLLVATSIDRVKTAMNELTNPQERLKVILEERERLEEQRQRMNGTTKPVTPKEPLAADAKPLKSAMKKTSATSNPLFPPSAAAKPPMSKNPLFSSAPSSKPLLTSSKKETPATKNATKHPLFGDAGNGTPANPLFSAGGGTPTRTLLSQGGNAGGAALTRATAAAPTAGVPSEDGLWRLLMSSSVDCLRKSAAEFDL